MSIIEHREALLRQAKASENYAKFLIPGIGLIAAEGIRLDEVFAEKSPNSVLPDIARRLVGNISLARSNAEQLATTCQPGTHSEKLPEAEARDQALGITNYEMGVNRRLENMQQKVEQALGHLVQAGEGSEELASRLNSFSEFVRESRQFFDGEAEFYRHQAEQL